ncbi:MAG TPA: site-specific DNA-methyltransferase [Candidatus Binatia bacterium]|jgi:DNA modification methylase|nr:site-specific DNA-methyltransferase [Candidatus Binatia bacterium]
MEKIAVTKTELIWPGKQRLDGSLREVPAVRLPLPRERLLANKARERGKRPWYNKLLWGDNLLAMRALLEEFAGKLDLIYIDPPFATGADFLFTSHIGDGKPQGKRKRSVVQAKAYRDTWGRGLSSYLSMLWQRLPLLRDLLSDTGSIYLHLGWDIGSYVLALMNEVFGEDCLQNIIIYNYGKFHHSKERWKRDFDVILFYAKNPTAWTFNHDAVLEEYRERTEIRFDKVDDAGRRYKIVKGRRVYYQGGVTPSSVWRLSNLQINAVESLGYPTQKTEELLAKIIAASSNPGDLVADFFCGSGTTLTVAEKLGRRWIGCDLGRFAIHTTRKRLLSLASCRPFELVDLGEAERRYWQNVTFSVSTKNGAAPSLSEYRAFILKLYGARPVDGFSGLHGTKGKALVYVGAVNTAISRDEICRAVEVCRQRKQPELHVLGWEWEREVERLPAAVREGRVKLCLLQIPREVTERRGPEKGEVEFFALASLEIEFRTYRDVRPSAPTATVTLKNFVIPKLVGVRSEVKQWSDYIDYWAVDWNFHNDVFVPGWVTYRSRRDRILALTSEPHVYEKPGLYRVLVKAVDIFGNETSQEINIKV